MPQQEKTYRTPTGQDTESLALDNSIGDLFRDHGERYIKTFKPPLHKIKLIKSIRICQSPGLGAKVLECKSCGHKKKIFLSCGNSQCPLCQNHKRNLWQAKVSQKMLNVPYVHTVFTIPHELHRLARLNKKIMYGITMRAAWECVKKVCKDPANVGGLPGMIIVLHTFGSDMKQHIHTHALITFGGIDDSGKWVWPKRKMKIAPFRQMCKEYRNAFVKLLKKEIKDGNITPVDNLENLIEEVSNKRWNVRNGRPTMDTTIIERYLARYINRVAITRSRLKYIAHQDKLKSTVQITYNDYRNKKDGQPAPKKVKHMNPLAAIDQFMQHVLPPYLQKSRHYGLHAHKTWKKHKDNIPNSIKRNTETVKNLFALIKALLGLDAIQCELCSHEEFNESIVSSDPTWIFNFITLPRNRPPPYQLKNTVILS